MNFIYKTTIIFCLLTMFSRLEAQEIELFADFEAGIPISNSLKNFHEELASQITFENWETTEKFDYNYGFSIGFRYNKNASVFFSNKVSGAKTSVADYSGYLRLTNELKGYTFGLGYEIMLREFQNGNLSLGLKTLVTPSSLTLISESEIMNTTQKDSLEFKSLDFGGALGINYEYSLNFITLRAHLDLNIYLGGKLKLKDDNSGAYLQDQNGNKVTTGWTGLLGGIGIIVPLSK